MKSQEALELLTKVAAQYRGTLEEHQMLQEAIRVLQEKILEARSLAKAKATKPSKTKNL